MANTGQMRDRLQLGGVLNPLDQVMGKIPGRSAGTVSNADKVRHVILEIADRLIKRFGRVWRFGREELERERRSVLLEDVGDVHDRCAIFVRAETRGQLASTFLTNGSGLGPFWSSLGPTARSRIPGPGSPNRLSVWEN